MYLFAYIIQVCITTVRFVEVPSHSSKWMYFKNANQPVCLILQLTLFLRHIEALQQPQTVFHVADSNSKFPLNRFNAQNHLIVIVDNLSETPLNGTP